MVWNHGIIGPYFFENEEGPTVTVNAERYKIMIETFLCIELHPRQQDLLWFQQDGATVHTAQIFIFKSSGQCFRADLFLVAGTSPGPSARLTLQYQTTTPEATLKARPANIRDLKHWILEYIQGIPRKCYNVLRQLFHRDRRNVSREILVTYKVSYSNNNDRWILVDMNAPDSVNKIVPHCLKNLFN